MDNDGLNGWLSPGGDWIPCEYLGHTDKAYEIMDRMENNFVHDREKCLVLRGESAVERLGFVKLIGIGPDKFILFPEVMYNTTKTTQQQVDWLNKNRDKLHKSQVDTLDKHLKYW